MIHWSIIVVNLGTFNLIMLLFGHHSGLANYLGTTGDHSGINAVRYLRSVIIGVQWNILGVNLGT